jgi:hypothetical protein
MQQAIVYFIFSVRPTIISTLWMDPQSRLQLAQTHSARKSLITLLLVEEQQD